MMMMGRDGSGRRVEDPAGLGRAGQVESKRLDWVYLHNGEGNGRKKASENAEGFTCPFVAQARISSVILQRI